MAILICFSAITGTLQANPIQSDAWTTTGDVTHPSTEEYDLFVSSTGMYGGTLSASISQTINTTPGYLYEAQFYGTAYSMTHPFDNIGLVQFGSSEVTFIGGDDHHGGASTFDSVFVATGDTTLIEVSYQANPAYGFLDAFIDGPTADTAMNVVSLPDACSSAMLLSMGMSALFGIKIMPGLKSKAKA